MAIYVIPDEIREFNPISIKIMAKADLDSMISLLKEAIDVGTNEGALAASILEKLQEHF